MELNNNRKLEVMGTNQEAQKQQEFYEDNMFHSGMIGFDDEN